MDRSNSKHKKMDPLIEFFKKLRSRGIRVLRKDFAQEKEPDKMGWIHIVTNKWRKQPREEKQYINMKMSVTHMPRR